MSAEQYDSAWCDLGPAVRQQCFDELLVEIRQHGSEVRRAYLCYVADFGVKTRPEYIRHLQAINAEIWQKRCAEIFRDLNNHSPEAA